jgi:hypothetical protein
MTAAMAGWYKLAIQKTRGDSRTHACRVQYSSSRPARPLATRRHSPLQLTMPTSAELKEHYDTHGYVIIPGLLTPSEHADLLAATDRAVARTRSGSWPHARVVGKQFPPYGVGDDIWGVQHAMHPALEEPVFARWYAGDAVCGAAKMLLGCQDEELQMGGCPPFS